MTTNNNKSEIKEELTWRDCVRQIDHLSEAMVSMKAIVAPVFLREFPTFENFTSRIKDVYREIAGGFLNEVELTVYELFLENFNMRNPEKHVIAARQMSAQWQVRVLRTVKILHDFYPDEIKKRKKDQQDALKAEVEARMKATHDSAKKKAQDEEELRSLRAMFAATQEANVLPTAEPEVEEPGDDLVPATMRISDVNTDSDVEDIPFEPLCLEDGPLCLEDGPLCLEDAPPVAQTLFLEDDPTRADESGDESEGEGAEPVCISSFFPEIPASTVLFEEFTGRRSPVKVLREKGLKVVQLDDISEYLEEGKDCFDAYVCVPSKGRRGQAVSNLATANRPSHILLPVSFHCRPEMRAAKDSALIECVYGPEKSFLDPEMGERLLFPPSMWVTVTPRVSGVKTVNPVISFAEVEGEKWDGSDLSTVVTKPKGKRKSRAKAKAKLTVPATVGGGLFGGITGYFNYVAKPEAIQEAVDDEEQQRDSSFSEGCMFSDEEDNDGEPPLDNDTEL